MAFNTNASKTVRPITKKTKILFLYRQDIFSEQTLNRDRFGKSQKLWNRYPYSIPFQKCTIQALLSYSLELSQQTTIGNPYESTISRIDNIKRKMWIIYHKTKILIYEINNYDYNQSNRYIYQKINYGYILFCFMLNGLLKSGQMQAHSWDNTVESYLAHHPNCCRVFRSGSLFDSAPVVDITYEMSDEFKKKINTLQKNNYYQ